MIVVLKEEGSFWIKLTKSKTTYRKTTVDAAFITTPDNVFYVSGFRSEPHERLLGVMIFKEAEPFVICPLMEVPDLKASGWTFEAVGHQDTEDAWEVLASAARTRNIPLKNIAIEKSHLTVERLERMDQLFEGAAFHRLDEQLNKMRNIKSEEELEKLRKAAALADYAIEVGCKEIAEGKTELGDPDGN